MATSAHSAATQPSAVHGTHTEPKTIWMSHEVGAQYIVQPLLGDVERATTSSLAAAVAAHNSCGLVLREYLCRCQCVPDQTSPPC